MKLPATVDRFEMLATLKGPLHLAIGMFDGVHLGHKAVIDSAVFSARRSGGISGVLTFDPHPSRLFRPENPTRLLMPFEKKSTMLRHMGVEVVLRKRFNADYASTEAPEFLSRLKGDLPLLTAVYVGTNFRFGKNRDGDVATLVESGKTSGVDVFASGRMECNGNAISSTRIREYLEAGEIESANALLGYNYFTDGTIVAGANLGRKIGFPTLNLPWHPECCPRFGVYCVRFRSDETCEWAYGVANYGVKPTVAETEGARPTLEVHALSGKELRAGDAVVVEWLRFLRPERKFDSIEALKARIAQDCALARQFVPDG